MESLCPVVMQNRRGDELGRGGSVSKVRRVDIVFVAVLVGVLVLGLAWPASARWLFLVVIAATYLWARARGLGGALRGDRSLSALAERRTSAYRAEHRPEESSNEGH
jgi:hypothetical protein